MLDNTDGARAKLADIESLARGKRRNPFFWIERALRAVVMIPAYIVSLILGESAVKIDRSAWACRYGFSASSRTRSASTSWDGASAGGERRVCLSHWLTVIGGLAEIGGLALVVTEIIKVQRQEFPQHRGWVRRTLAWVRALTTKRPDTQPAYISKGPRPGVAARSAL